MENPAGTRGCNANSGIALFFITGGTATLLSIAGGAVLAGAELGSDIALSVKEIKEACDTKDLVYAGSVGEKFVDQSMSSADAELIMAAVDGIFALSDVFDAVTAIKALSRFKKLSKDTAEVLLGTKKSYKLLLEVEPELLDGGVLKLNQDIAIKLLSSNENSDFIKLLSSTDSNSYIKYR